MSIEVIEIEGPEFLAPILINDDCSGMEDRDQTTLDAFLASIPEGAYVVSTTDDEPSMGRWIDGLLYHLVTYVCHRIAA